MFRYLLVPISVTNIEVFKRLNINPGYGLVGTLPESQRGLAAVGGSYVEVVTINTLSDSIKLTPGNDTF